MKLAISAALLSIAMTAPLAAQSTSDGPPPPPPDAGMHGGGPHGPHGRGMFGPGRAAHHVEAIAGSPFTAQFAETSNITNRDGKQEQRSATSIVYRDSQGRVREEITLQSPPPRPAAATTASAPSAPPAPRTMVTIVDPVAHTITHLNADRQTAYVQTVPAEFFTRMQQREDKAANGPSQHQRENAVTTSLGSKVFAGVSATGEQTVMTLPARNAGAAHTITRQTWFSPDVKLEVSSTETSDRGTHSDTLSTFTKSEPDPALFQVPAGYTTSAAPEHFGRPHGGPGGPGGDDAPPPPPSM